MGACRFNVNSSDHCHGCENELRERLAATARELDALKVKANNLARLAESVAYAPVAGYYEQFKNAAPLTILRRAVEDVDALTQRKR